MKVLVEEGPPDGVLTITINRPEVRNAIDGDVAEAIASALDRLDDTSGLRVAVLTGAGKGFSAGMDLNAFAAGERPYAGDRGFAGIARRPPAKPIVAAVEGFAVAGGLEVALACDVIVAGATARLGLPEVRRSLVPAGGALLRLPQRMSAGQARKLVLSGDLISAGEAERIGLVDVVTADGEALTQAMSLAARMAANGPLAVAATKRILDECAQWPAADFWDRQESLVAPVRASEDAREGARSFMEKRPPRWRGL